MTLLVPADSASALAPSRLHSGCFLQSGVRATVRRRGGQHPLLPGGSHCSLALVLLGARTHTFSNERTHIQKYSDR